MVLTIMCVYEVIELYVLSVRCGKGNFRFFMKKVESCQVLEGKIVQKFVRKSHITHLNSLVIFKHGSCLYYELQTAPKSFFDQFWKFFCKKWLKSCWQNSI